MTETDLSTFSLHSCHNELVAVARLNVFCMEQIRSRRVYSRLLGLGKGTFLAVSLQSTDARQGQVDGSAIDN